MTPKVVRWRELKHHGSIYLFVLPALLMIGLFAYYPAANGAFHSFFRWNGRDISEYNAGANYKELANSLDFWGSFRVALIIGVWNIAKLIPAIAVAACINRVRSSGAQFWYRVAFVAPMVVPTIILVLIWRTFFFDATMGYLNQGLDSTGMLDWLAWFGKFSGLTDVFVPGKMPSWIGDGRLILFSSIIWGFPWVASFAVLTHLAKLQSIPKELIEAADLDGASWWTKFTKLELPMIAGSINILIVLVLIDTFRDATMIYGLVGITGGPGGVVSMPALIMMQKAFLNQDSGSACAVGLVLAILVIVMKFVLDSVINWQTLATWHKMLLRVLGAAVGFLCGHYLHSPFLALVATLLVFPWSALLECWRSARSPGFAVNAWTESRQAGVLEYAGEQTPHDTRGGGALMIAVICVFPAFLAVWWYLPSIYSFTLLAMLAVVPWKQIVPQVQGALTAEKWLPLSDPWAPTAAQTQASNRLNERFNSAAYQTWLRIGEVALRISKHAFIWGVLAFAYLPLILMLIVSVKTNQQYYEASASLTFPLHFENWSSAWTSIQPSLANSIFIAVSSTAITLLLALGGAYFFVRVKVPGSKFLWGAFILLMTLPDIANLVPLFNLLRQLNLLNTLTCLIAVGVAGGLVFAMFVLRNFIADLPQDLFEAAEIDGASHFRQMFTIVAPLAAPILGVIGLMHFISRWNDFIFPLIVMTDSDKLPLMVQLMRLNGEYIKEFGPMMAGFALASIPVILLFIACMRLFTRGLTERRGERLTEV